MNIRRRSLILAAILPASALFSPCARAGGTIYWNNTGTSWNSVNSWSTDSGNPSAHPAAVPGDGDIASFNVFTAQTISLDADQSVAVLTTQNVGSVHITSGATTHTLNDSGGITAFAPLTLDCNVYINYGGNETWTNSSSGPLILNGSLLNLQYFQDLILNGGGAFIFNGPINSAGIFFVNGTSTLTLAGNNTLSGTLDATNTAHLVLASNSAISALTHISLDNSSFLDLNGTSTTAANLQVNTATASIINSSTVSAFFAGSITAGALKVTPSIAPITLSGAILDGGAGSCTLTKTGANNLILAGIADNPTLFANASTGTLTLAKTSSSSVHAISALGLTIAANATVALSGTGGDQINDAAVITGTGTLDLNGMSETIGNFNGIGTVINSLGSSTGSLSIANSNTAIFNALVAGSNPISFIKSGGGVLILERASTFSGGTTISLGLLRTALGSTLGNASNTLAIGSNASLDLFGTSQSVGALSGPSTAIVTNSSNAAATLTIGSGGSSSTFDGQIQNGNAAIALVKTGAGSFALSAAQTYTGTTTVNAGTLILGTGSSYFVYSGGNITINNGAALRVKGGRYDFNGINFTFGSTGGGTLDYAGDASQGGFVFTNSNTLTTTGGAQNVMTSTSPANQYNLNFQSIVFNVARGTDPASDLTVNAPLVNSAGSLTKNGNGILTLSGANNFSGSTTVNAGKLVITQSFSNSSDYTIIGGTLQFTGGGHTISPPVIINGTPNNWSATLDLSANFMVTNYGGPTANGPPTLTRIYNQILSGRGTQNASGISSYTGNGITSSTAAANNLLAAFDKFYVGAINNADLAAIGLNPAYTTFGNLSGIGTHNILTRYTYAGDINLDGKIDIDDYNYIDAGFGHLLSAFSGQIIGDFNNDGIVNIDDYNIIDTGFGFQGSPLDSGNLSPLVEPASLQAAPVPEPATALLLCPVVALTLIFRRKRFPRYA